MMVWSASKIWLDSSIMTATSDEVLTMCFVNGISVAGLRELVVPLTADWITLRLYYSLEEAMGEAIRAMYMALLTAVSQVKPMSISDTKANWSYELGSSFIIDLAAKMVLVLAQERTSVRP